MKPFLTVLISFILLTACAEKQKGLAEYEHTMVKFGKRKFEASNGEFSMVLPHNWHAHEDPTNSDTLLYSLEAGSKGRSLVAITVLKLKALSGSTATEFETLLKQSQKRASNIKLIEQSTLKVGKIQAKTALATIEHNGKITQIAIDCFIPTDQQHYYLITMVTDNNKRADLNLAMLLQCVKSFRLH